MTPQKYICADNIRLTYINTDKFKTESLTLSFDMPLTPESFVLSQVLCQLLGRGCERLPSVAHINRELDELYSASLGISTQGKAEVLSLCINIDVISDRFVTDGTNVLRGTLKTAADMLMRPLLRDGVFVPETLEKVKNAFADSTRSIKNHPRLYAAARLNELLDRAKDRYISYEFILEYTQNIDAAQLYAFYSEMLSSTAIKAFYVGAQPPEVIASALKDAFSDFSGIQKTVIAMPKIAAPLPFVSRSEDMPIGQGTLAMGFRTGAGIVEQTHTVLTVFNEILGASPASKLFLNVRERMSLCYSCGSKISHISGNLTVYAGLDNANRDIAKNEILRQIDLIKQGEISAAELNAARRNIEYNYSQIYDSPRSLINFYYDNELLGSDETIEAYKKKLLSVSAEDVSRLAAQTVFDTQFYINGVGTESDGDDYE